MSYYWFLGRERESYFENRKNPTLLKPHSVFFQGKKLHDWRILLLSFLLSHIPDHAINQNNIEQWFCCYQHKQQIPVWNCKEKGESFRGLKWFLSVFQNQLTAWDVLKLAVVKHNVIIYIYIPIWLMPWGWKGERSGVVAQGRKTEIQEFQWIMSFYFRINN